MSDEIFYKRYDDFDPENLEDVCDAADKYYDLWLTEKLKRKQCEERVKILTDRVDRLEEDLKDALAEYGPRSVQR